MPATSFYVDTTDETQKPTQVFDTEPTMDDNLDEAELSVSQEELEELETASIEQEQASLVPSPNRRSTDLVRLYLQEIGRVRLFGRDEEVSEAQ